MYAETNKDIYLEDIAKSYNPNSESHNLALPGSGHPLYKSLKTCGKMAIRGECKKGHCYLKVLKCKKEWCEICGKEKSEAHQGIYAKFLSRLKKVDQAGYLVITFPEEMRENLRNKVELGKIMIKVKRSLKGAGYGLGLQRWHWSGDRDKKKWLPHLNIILGGEGRLEKSELERLKSRLRALLGLPLKGNIHYSYKTGPAALCHLARYVTRPTWGGLWDWEEELAIDLHGFRKNRWWGNWSKMSDVWDLTGDGKIGALVELAKGQCPDCGGAILWVPGVQRLPLALPITHLGGGFYRIEICQKI